MRKFYIISLFSLLAALASCSRTSEQSVVSDRTAQVNVIPQPHHLQMAEGAFRIDRDTKIFIDVQSDEMLRIAGFLNERLSSAAGFSLEISGTMPESDAIYFMNAGLPAESYGMNVTPDRVVIDYGDGAGAFYALQTLFQLLPPEIFADSRQKGVRWEVPCLSIEDEPRFAYRGMHLDVCLHFFDIDFLKKYIDIMALHKVNRFH